MSDSTLKQVLDAINQMSGRFDAIDTKLAKVDQRFDAVDAKLVSVDNRLVALDQKQDICIKRIGAIAQLLLAPSESLANRE